ncbi:MAG: F0F1 ATP synthase subunit delta [Gammaproteobacteria bacterium]|nr:MAG: F0F1 ATP synthase subunit delta [Gammaproteobacteria bacterium]
MAESRTLARPYAEAVFALARQGSGLVHWSDMLRVMTEVATDERVAALATDPRVSPQHLTGLLLDVGGDTLGHDGKNLVRLLVENERLSLLPEIVEQYEELRADAEGIVEVEAISAFELDQAQAQKIAQAMQQKLGREVRLTTGVDRSLLGGVVVRAGDLVIDGSVKGRLHDLAAQLNQ